MRVFSVKKPLGVIAAVAIAIAGAISPIMGVSPASAAPSLGSNPSSNIAVVVGSTTTLNNSLDAAGDLQVTGYPTNDLVRVVVSVDSGTIQLASTTGLGAIVGYYADTTARSSLGWQSTQADANAALAGLKFIAGGSATTANVTLTSSYAGPSGGSATPAYYATNGHYYQYVTTLKTWDNAQADIANNPLTYTFNGLRGYLATSTSAGENDFIKSRVGSAAVWLGGRRDATDSQHTGDNAWYWTEGPEAGTKFYVEGTGPVSPQYENFANGEPNGWTSHSGETALQMLAGTGAGAGEWNDLQATDGSQNLGYVVEYGGMPGDAQTYDSVTRVLPITVAVNQIVDVNWSELNFDYAHHVDKVGNGLTVGNKVLYQNVTTRNGVCVDGVVTTKSLTGATVAKYEVGTGAGGTTANFEVDLNVTTANGNGEFQFDFYVCGTYAVTGGVESGTKVVLKNTGVTAIDIDYNQWNELSGFDSYTMASNTHLYECPVNTACNTTHQRPGSYPASLRFQGPSANETTIVEDQVVVNYGNIDSFTIKFGRTTVNNPNYFGVAFKGLPWGSAVPATQGAATYNIVYNGNGSTGGTVPASQNGVTGQNFAVSANSGTLTRTGYTFAGWNTAANGLGTSYSAGANIQMTNGGLTLYAVWTPATLTLTYNANGGTGAPTAENRSAGTSANLSATIPTRAGYTFARWNTASNGTGTNYNSSASYTMPATASTLYAVWTAASGTLAYNANGGSGAPSNENGAAASTTTVSNTAPTLSNFVFAGWNTLANGTGTSYASGASFTFTSSTVTLYAQWTPSTLYTLNFNSNGATGGPSVTSAYGGQSITQPSTNPTRTGYTCSGWATTPTGTAITWPFTMPSANTTLYAVCTPDVYHVTYNQNKASGTSAQDPANLNYLSSYTTDDATRYSGTNTGFYQTGWATAVDANRDPIGSVYALGSSFLMPAANVTLYAVWVSDAVKIVYNANGGTGGPVAGSGSLNSPYSIESGVPSRTGYTFAGWAATGGATGTYIVGGTTVFTPTNNVVLTAQWTPVTHTVTYDVNGGSSTAPTDANAYNYLATATVSATLPTRTGYVFLGWNSAANGTGTNYAAGNSIVMQTSNVTLYAQWSGNPYRLNYNANGGTGAPASENRVVDATAALASTAPTRNGYTFNGWNTNAGGTGTSYAAASSFTMPGSNTTLYAQWLLNTSAVTYNANGGSGAPAGANYSFGSSVTVSSTVPTYAGYTFTGWNTRCDGTGTSYSGAEVFTMGGSSVELCAQWSANGYQLVYDGNGGTGVPNASSKSFGSTVTVTSTIPSRSGYSFIAWNTLANGTGSTRATAGTFVMPSANVTLYAIWSLNAYTVYYNMNGGTGSISPQPARFGNNITVSNFAPTRAGYTFAGWNTEALGAGTSYAGGSGLTMPASNVTLYAQWTPNNYTLNYDANGGGGAPAAQNGLHAGDAVTLSATTPTQTGFRFNGWNTRADGTGVTYLPSSSLTMPTGNVYVYALWVAENLELIYNANGGTGEPAATTAATLSTVTVTSITPTRTGYNFTGWNTQAGGGGTSQANGSTFTMPNTAVTLYAQWTRKTVTLHYNLNGGAAKANMLAPADVVSTFETIESLDPANDFEKTNANFVAWNTRADGTGTAYAAESDYVMPASDVTLYAQWSGVYYVVEYNANGGSGEPAAQIAAAGENLNLASQTPNLNGYEFTGWTEVTQGSTYNPGASLTMPSTNVTMLANYRVRTSSLGGSAPVTTPVTPTPPVDENGPTPDPIVTVAPLTVKEMVFFKGDKSALLPTTITALKKLIAIAKKRGVAAKITIIGRVKETADKSYDMKLSKARAVNVANYLKKAGLQGPYSVVAAGISPENRWVSRRVEITVTWPKK